MALTRRRVLLGAAASVGVGGAGFSLSLGAPASGATVLSAPELAVVRAVAEVMFPGAPFPLDGLEAGVAEAVDRIVADTMDDARAAAFRYVLRTLEWGTLVSRGRRFSRLPPAERVEVLEAWSEPSVVARRVAGDSLKAVLGMAYFGHPAILGAIGWRETCGGGAT